MATQAHTELDASGEAVGLPPGVMGNSEVGHLTIGAGRIIYQDVMRITKAIETGAFFRNAAILDAINTAGDDRRTLHLWGLLSDGSVHSHIDHLFAMLDLAAANGSTIAVHAVLDGRDKPPRSALAVYRSARGEAAADRARPDRDGHRTLLRDGSRQTMGAYRARLARDGRWRRLAAPTAREAVEARTPRTRATNSSSRPLSVIARPIADGDQVICYNFRADRARELTAALALANVFGFNRPRFPQVGYVCMTEYDPALRCRSPLAPRRCATRSPRCWRAGLRNLRVAETEKYAHVTYFLNGGAEQPFPLEERVLIPSSKVATYDLEPTMQAAAIATRAAEEIAGGKFDVVVMNFANPDMVGHTGNFEATVKAVEASDAALGVVIDALESAAASR